MSSCLEASLAPMEHNRKYLQRPLSGSGHLRDVR
jgi:hypothetical protein